MYMQYVYIVKIYKNIKIHVDRKCQNQFRVDCQLAEIIFNPKVQIKKIEILYINLYIRLKMAKKLCALIKIIVN